MTKPPSPRPLSIKVIAIWYMLVSLPAFFFLQTSNSFFGLLLTGTSVIPYNLCMALLYLVAGIGLWKLWEPARRTAIYLQCYYALNIWLAYANPSYRDFMAQNIIARSPNIPQSSIVSFLPFFIAFAGLLKTARTGIVLWFLIKRKSAFVKATTPTQASTQQ